MHACIILDTSHAARVYNIGGNMRFKFYWSYKFGLESTGYMTNKTPRTKVLRNMFGKSSRIGLDWISIGFWLVCLLYPFSFKSLS